MGQRKNETREQYNARMNEYMKARYKAVSKELESYKVLNGCKDCGYDGHHAGLQFDHVNERFGDNNKKISALAPRGLSVVMKHIEKNCDVVCGTCHGIRTWHRKLHRALQPNKSDELSVFEYDCETPCEYNWCLVGR